MISSLRWFDFACIYRLEGEGLAKIGLLSFIVDSRKGRAARLQSLLSSIPKN